MPGAIDAHVHINEPGRTNWEGFDSATRAAAAGGLTTIVDMPLNSSPVTTTLANFQQKLKASKGKLHVNCGFYGGLVPDNHDSTEALLKAGVLGIKAFLTHSGIDDFPNATEADLDAVMPTIAKYNRPMLVHCELTDKAPPTANQKRDPRSYQQYLESRPRSWENEAVELMIRLCEKHQCPTHIVHVSSSDALIAIQQAKEKGLPITAETCPHYLYFHAEGIPDGNTLYKCAPPIRTKENNEQLKRAFQNGVLDFVASDHSPAPPTLKEIESGNLIKAWGGIAGLQYLLPAAWTSLKEQLTLEEFIPLLTEAPAKYLRIDDSKGYLKTGMNADFTIWQPEESFLVEAAYSQHKHKLSPYVGQHLFGKTVATFVNGMEVFNQSILHENVGKVLYSEIV